MSQAQEPRVVRSYFGRRVGRAHATVGEVFTADLGWKRYPIRKRVSRAWARKARREGVTNVALRCDGRLADFRIEELLR